MAMPCKIPILPFTFLFIYIPVLCSGHRKILHQPFFPAETLPPATQPPLPSPRQQPKYPFSTTVTPFFPLSLSPPNLSPPPPTAVAVTFPANISSSLPLSNRSSKPISRKLLIIAVSLSLLSAAVIAASAAVTILRHRRRHTPEVKTESRRLFPSETHSSDKPPSANVSGEFLYLGTLKGAEESYNKKYIPGIATSSAGEYQRLSSPELRPLPPLPRHQPFSREFSDPEEQDEIFFSPNLSPNNNNFNYKNNPFLCSPIREKTSNPFSSPTRDTNSSKSKSPDSTKDSIFRNNTSYQTDVPFEPIVGTKPPLPPPLPSARFGEMFEPMKGRHVAENDWEEGEEEGGLKPRLKPLHWDKVRASSDRAMAWDQIKSSSFQLNEEMIETLFMVNDPSSTSRKNTRPLDYTKLNQENRALDPKKSQNIAILLRALNVTVDEVCEALVEGTTDTLGTELLESLLKMGPSEDEERKIKELTDTSSTKQGPAEKFLRAILDIPFAFKRVDAMLYVANFDSEIEYLNRSFHTLKAACDELKNSKMFRKLLDAVLQTGNRINQGTNRGEAHAFKLDTLLKLVEVKGTDGKTTLLHFVVQEISLAEGSKLTDPQEPLLESEIEFLKLGLRVVSGLSSELDNVKRAADVDSEVLGDEVAKLSSGVGKVQEILKVNGIGEKFSESMKEFLNRAEREIGNVRSLESECLCLVREITEFFHGDDSSKEGYGFSIFKVVRDFISVLDCVCREVGKVNERSFLQQC